MTVDLAGTLEEIAETLQAASSPQETLDAITHAAVDVIEGSSYAAVSLVIGRKEIETVAGTDDVVMAIDQAQYETHEGPCLDALYDEDAVRMNDIEFEKRWPDFTARARDHGVLSMMCFRLFLWGDDAAALNMYAVERDVFTDESQETGRLLATHAAVALAAARKVDQLEQAVDSRDVIGQAKGILMERHDLNADSAFNLLTRASQKTHIRLVEIAQRIAGRD
jgi:transcriptional regulator with GAF, ATPase, and Fis domain